MAMDLIEKTVKVSSSLQKEFETQSRTDTCYAQAAIRDIACGSLAGMVGKVIEYPFDTVKVRLQSQLDGVTQIYTGPMDCIRKSIQKDGALGLYRGLSAPLLGAAVENSSLFLSVGLDGYNMFARYVLMSVVSICSKRVTNDSSERFTFTSRSRVMWSCIWSDHLARVDAY